MSFSISFLIEFLSGYGDLTDIVYGCLEEASEKRREGRAIKHEYMLEKVRNCIKDLKRI